MILKVQRNYEIKTSSGNVTIFILKKVKESGVRIFIIEQEQYLQIIEIYRDTMLEMKELKQIRL